jgi:hypothetical protein
MPENIFFSINHPFQEKQVVVGYLPLPTLCTINLEQIMKAIKSPGTVARGNWDSGLIISYDIPRPTTYICTKT